MSRDAIDSVWRQLEALAEQFGRAGRLRDAAEPDDIEALLQLGLPVPEALVRSLQIHDGEELDDVDLDGAEIDGDEETEARPLFPSWARLLSCEEIVEQFQEDLEVDADYPDDDLLDDDDDDEPLPRLAFGPVVPRRIAGKRLCFMSSVDHNWALDFAPDHGGQMGQVIRYSEDDGVWLQCADGFVSFLQGYASALQDGEVVEVEGEFETLDEAEFLAWPPLTSAPGFDPASVDVQMLRAIGKAGHWGLADQLSRRCKVALSPIDVRRFAARLAGEDGDDETALADMRAVLEEDATRIDDILFAVELMGYCGHGGEQLSTLSLAINRQLEPKLLMARARWHRDQSSETPHPTSFEEGLKWLSSPAGQQHSAVCIERALEDFDRALAIDNRVAWQFDRAECLLHAGMWDEAEQAYDALVTQLRERDDADRLERAAGGLERARAGEEGSELEAQQLLESMDEAMASLRGLFGADDSDDDVVSDFSEIREAFAEVVDETEKGRQHAHEHPDELDEQAHSIAMQLAARHANTTERYAAFDAADIDRPASKWLDRAQAALEADGFRLIDTVEPVRNTEINGNRVPVRLMISGDGHSLAAIWRLQGSTMAYEVVDIESELGDGRILISNNSGAANPFQPPPKIDQFALPLGTAPSEVYRTHQQRLLDSGDEPIMLNDLDDILAVQERMRLIKRGHDQAQGWIGEAELRGLLGASYPLLGAKVKQHLAQILG